MEADEGRPEKRAMILTAEGTRRRRYDRGQKQAQILAAGGAKQARDLGC